MSREMCICRCTTVYTSRANGNKYGCVDGFHCGNHGKGCFEDRCSK